MNLSLCGFIRCADIAASIARVRAKRRESGRGAHTVNLIFSLRALAAKILLREHYLKYCNTALRAAVRADCSAVSSGNELDTGQNRPCICPIRWRSSCFK